MCSRIDKLSPWQDTRNKALEVRWDSSKLAGGNCLGPPSPGYFSVFLFSGSFPGDPLKTRRFRCFKCMNPKIRSGKRQERNQTLGVVLGGSKLETSPVVFFLCLGPQLYNSAHYPISYATLCALKWVFHCFHCKCTPRKLRLFLICRSLRVVEGVCGFCASVFLL